MLLGRTKSMPSIVLEGFQKDLKLPIPAREYPAVGRERCAAASPAPMTSKTAGVPASPLAGQVRHDACSVSPVGREAALQESFMNHASPKCGFQNMSEAEEIAELRKQNIALREENVEIRERVLRQ